MSVPEQRKNLKQVLAQRERTARLTSLKHLERFRSSLVELGLSSPKPSPVPKIAPEKNINELDPLAQPASLSSSQMTWGCTLLILAVSVLLAWMFFKAVQTQAHHNMNWSTAETVEDKVIVLERLVSGAELKGNSSRRALGEEAESILKLVGDDPPKEYHPQLQRLAEACARRELPSPASRAYELTGNLRLAAKHAEESGDIDRSKDLLSRLGESEDSEEVTGLRRRAGLELLTQAETAYHSIHNPATKTKAEKMSIAAAQELRGIPISEQDFRRLLFLRLKNAKGEAEVKRVFEETTWEPPSSVSEEDYRLRRLGVWVDFGSQVELEPARTVHSRVMEETRTVPPTTLSKEALENLLALRLRVAYADSHFEEALNLAKQLFPDDSEKLRWYEFARAHPESKVTDIVYEFAEPQKSREENTSVYIFSPTGRYTNTRVELVAQPPNSDIDMDKVSPMEGGGVRVALRTERGNYFMVSFNAGYHTRVAPGRYDRIGHSGFSADVPSMEFRSETHGLNGKMYGQFVVHEIEWESDKKEKVSRFAADFLLSQTNKINDVCLGRIRYRSRYE